jgi:guanylate kinase
MSEVLFMFNNNIHFPAYHFLFSHHQWKNLKKIIGPGTESEASLLARLNKAAYELSFKHHFNEIIINDQLDKACLEAEKIVENFINELK